MNYNSRPTQAEPLLQNISNLLHRLSPTGISGVDHDKALFSETYLKTPSGRAFVKKWL